MYRCTYIRGPWVVVNEIVSTKGSCAAQILTTLFVATYDFEQIHYDFPLQSDNYKLQLSSYNLQLITGSFPIKGSDKRDP